MRLTTITLAMLLAALTARADDHPPYDIEVPALIEDTAPTAAIADRPVAATPRHRREPTRRAVARRIDRIDAPRPVARRSMRARIHQPVAPRRAKRPATP
jgi:hypothetical protein